MKDNSSFIAVVLDRSGSMGAVVRPTIDGFNEFVKKQREVPGEATLLLAQFDDEYEVVFEKPLPDAPELTDKTFVPRGTTALYDAIGRTIQNVGRSLEARPESERPSKVIFVIITDGFENASKDFSQAKIKEMIAHQKFVYSWDFVFLGANQDAVLTAAGFGISGASALSYNSNPLSLRAASASLSNYTTTVRTGNVTSFTAQDRKDAKQ